MTRKRHTEEQIIAVLKEAQAGVSVLVYSTREVPEQRWATGRGGDGGRGLVKGNLRQPHRLIGHSARDWQASCVGAGTSRSRQGDRTMSYIAMLLHHIIYHLDTHRAAYLSRLASAPPWRI